MCEVNTVNWDNLFRQKSVSMASYVWLIIQSGIFLLLEIVAFIVVEIIEFLIVEIVAFLVVEIIEFLVVEIVAFLVVEIVAFLVVKIVAFLVVELVWQIWCLCTALAYNAPWPLIRRRQKSIISPGIRTLTSAPDRSTKLLMRSPSFKGRKELE